MKKFISRLFLIMRKKLILKALFLAKPLLNSLINYNQGFDKPLFHLQTFPYHQFAPVV
jgi:hypothetical protein